MSSSQGAAGKHHGSGDSRAAVVIKDHAVHISAEGRRTFILENVPMIKGKKHRHLNINFN